MNELNALFFDEYIRLDRLCADAYGTDKGITNYIDLMKETPAARSRTIDGWEEDLQYLWRFRHMRNYLAHNPGAFDEELCTQGDVQWLKHFSSRMLTQKDPLAQLRRQETPKPATDYSRGTGSFECYPETEPEFECDGKVILAILALVALICVAVLLNA